MAEINANGATITRDFFHDRDRYDYDVSLGKSWEQFDTDQDASYYGVWVNISERKILSFVEGDEILSESPTLEIFRAELQALADFHGAPPPAFTTIDEHGNITHFFQERPKV